MNQLNEKYTAGDIRKMSRELRALPSRSRRGIFDKAADMLDYLADERKVDEVAYFAGLCDQMREALDEANESIRILKGRLEDDGK